jgi:hypothetical protein
MIPTLFKMTPLEQIVSDLANATCKRIANQVRIKLQGMTDVRLFGDDSIVKNVWEELCVQLQGEESLMWSAYEETVEVLVKGYIAGLPRFELEAVWLQTDRAFDLVDPTENLPDGKRTPVDEDAVVKYIIQDYIYTLASDWSNARIEGYLNRPSD